MEKQAKVIEINDKVKDTFFKTVYSSEERRRKLAAFLLGIDVENAEIKNVKPVIFGNKENDLAFLCDDAIYCMMEEQSYVCVNMPYRILEYITTALRSTVDSEETLYASKRVWFPVPKLYVTFVGLEEKESNLPHNVQYEMKLSDSYKQIDGIIDQKWSNDLEVTVHAYDFRMTYEETLVYIDYGVIPERMAGYTNDLRDYALFCNSLRYVQRALKSNKYQKAKSAGNENELLILLRNREIFVDLLSDKEVCNMTVAQFSREDIIKSQGREEGRQEGRTEGTIEGQQLKLIDLVCRKMQKGRTIEEIADALEEKPETIEKIYNVALKYHADENMKEKIYQEL